MLIVHSIEKSNQQKHLSDKILFRLRLFFHRIIKSILNYKSAKINFIHKNLSYVEYNVVVWYETPGQTEVN